MRKLKLLYLTIIVSSLLFGCSDFSNKEEKEKIKIVEEKEISMEEHTMRDSIVEKENYINPNGMVVKDRFIEPKGYKRTKEAKNSFGDFVRNYPLKEDGSAVLLYNGQEKGNQKAHEAVLAMNLEEEDLQQCADSIMRIYAEYLYQKEEYQQMNFHFVNGFNFDFDTWQRGHNLVINGNTTLWGNSSKNNSSNESFERYLHTLFAYASTLSMEQESKAVSLSDIKIGDIFIKGGSPGHVVMVADVCVNPQGEKVFLLAQGFMPAQEFHIVKNSYHENNPWYAVSEIVYPLRTPEYTFERGSLMRPPYLIQ